MLSKSLLEESKRRYVLVHAVKSSERAGACSLVMQEKRCVTMAVTSVTVIAAWVSICIHSWKSTEAVSSACRSALFGVRAAIRLKESWRARRKGVGEGMSELVFTLPSGTPLSMALSHRYSTSIVTSTPDSL